MIKVIKRTGKTVPYEGDKIIVAIGKAMVDARYLDIELSKKIEREIYRSLVDNDITEVEIETIQDMVEDSLIEHGAIKTAKTYIKYRADRARERKYEIDDTEYGILSKEFLSRYKHLDPPMTDLGFSVFYRTYSRYLPDKERREYWWETVRRAVEYNVSLIPTPKKEAEELYDNIFHLRQFLSGRTLFTGGTDVSTKYPMSNYNCSFQIIDEIESFRDIFYLLMIGSGAGLRIRKSDVEKLPKFRTNVDIIPMVYNPVDRKDRLESTELRFKAKNIAEVVVGDSKEGWVQSLDFVLKLLTANEYKHVNTILLDFNSVRPRGEKLKTFGGTASGPEALINIFVKLEKILMRHADKGIYKLKTIDALDIANIIGEGVVVGGVRRTSEIILFDADDIEVAEAKGNLYIQTGGKWVVDQDIIHRAMSNNTISYKEKPTREEWKAHLAKMRYSGEPGLLNEPAASKRRPNFHGINPCAEILLNNKGLCNLTTLNAMAFVLNGVLDKAALLRAQRLSARASYRMTNVELELPRWDKVQREERLTGVSLTGWQDMVNATGMTREEQGILLKEMRQVAKEETKKLSEQIGANDSLLVTTLKPEGCWTKEFTRTTDDGILFVHEILPTIDETEGFTDVSENKITVNENLLTKVYKNEIKDIYQITLKNKRILKISPAHPMMVNGEWTQAKDLKIGDEIEYKLGSYTNNKNVSLVDSNYKSKTSALVLDTPSEMSEELAYLLGAYFANGSFTTKHRIKFHAQHMYLHEKVQAIWKKLFGIETKIIKSSDGDLYTQDFASANIRHWLAENDLEKEEDFDRLPLPIRKSSWKTILSFIAGYADNDGCFHGDTFSIDMSNKTFARHLQEVGEAVGLSFGFSVNEKRKNSFSQKPMYKLHLSRAFSEDFAIDYLNSICTKGVIKKDVVRGKNPYIIEGIELLENQQTYDIEVENSHWYYQGGLKSHNTLSQLPTVSSGLHYSHSPYYIRRVRINSHDPVVKALEELKYPIFPENGQTWKTCNTKVVEFPVQAPEGRTKYDVSAIEQLENYKMFMTNYVDHNASITVSVREHEWDAVEEWVWENWDELVAVSFLSLDDSFYNLLPYEAIDKQEYERRVSESAGVKLTPEIIAKYEIIGEDFELDESCDTGACPVR